jgi:hypothetical protein
MHKLSGTRTSTLHSTTQVRFFQSLHTYIQSHSYNTFIRRHSLRPLSICLLLVCSEGNTSRIESNSGLPYSKQTRYQMSHAAP